MKKLSTSTIIQLILLSTVISLFFACSNNDPNKLAGQPTSLEQFKQTNNSKTTEGSHIYWAIPEQYKDVPIEQIKEQIEITDYFELTGAATNAGTEDMIGTMTQKAAVKSIGAGGAAVEKDTPKNKRDREALAEFNNKLISLEGVVNTTATQKTAPLDIQERIPGKYEIWFCADKNQNRKPCRYRAFLLYEAPEGKGDTLFTHDNVIRFWGVVLEEQIGILKLPNGRTYKRYPKIRVLDLEIIK